MGTVTAGNGCVILPTSDVTECAQNWPREVPHQQVKQTTAPVTRRQQGNFQERELPCRRERIYVAVTASSPAGNLHQPAIQRHRE